MFASNSTYRLQCRVAFFGDMQGIAAAVFGIPSPLRSIFGYFMIVYSATDGRNEGQQRQAYLLRQR